MKTKYIALLAIPVLILSTTFTALQTKGIEQCLESFF